MLCSKFKDSIFGISSNANKQTNKPPPQKKPHKINNKAFIFERFDQMLMIMAMPPLN
jgi:hypothetical protein